MSNKVFVKSFYSSVSESDWLTVHCVSKNVPLCDCPYLRQILTDFQIFFTGTFCGQVAVVLLLNIPPHLNYVSTLPCETLIVKNV